MDIAVNLKVTLQRPLAIASNPIKECRMSPHEPRTQRTSEIDVRIGVLQHVVKNCVPKGGFVAVEPRYAHSKRRADVLVVSDTCHAYEIKSDADNLSRLKEQLDDYKRTFDFVTVVTTLKHLPGILERVGRNEGVLVVRDGKLSPLREARRNKRLSKRNLIHMCSKEALAKVLGVQLSTHSLIELQSLAERKLLLSILQHTVSEELKRRFQAQYQVFASEAAIPYAENDLALLRCYDRLQYL